MINLPALALVLIMLAGNTCGCASFGRKDDQLFSKDKLYHFAAAGTIGAGVTAVGRSNGLSRTEAPVLGISVAIGAGAGKEFVDKNVRKKFWSWKDMFWDLLGGISGSLAVSAFY